MMNLQSISDDFFSIGDIAILYRNSNNSNYDFPFRNHFDCHSVVSAVKQPVLLHIGAIEDYDAVSDTLNEMGMKLLVPEKEHLRCSTIEGWYPALKEKTPFTRVYETLPPLEELLRDFSFPVFIE